MALRVGYVRDHARKLLKENGQDRSPINLQVIVEHLGFEYVEVDNFPSELSALCVEKGEKLYAAVNCSHHRNRKRFSLAHELGHWVLGHTREFDMEQVTIDNPPDPSKMKVKNKDQEAEANEFAGELLVPMKLLKVSFGKTQDIESLAKEYEVSKEVITIRIMAARLL